MVNASVGPSESEEMLVLASSRKNGARCVAGLGLTSGRLVRPVSSGTGELYFSSCAVDGAWPEVFDRVRFGHTGHDGSPYQPENLVIDGSAWQKLAPLEPQSIPGILEPHVLTGDRLLGNYQDSLAAHIAADGVAASLALVEPDWVEFEKESVPWGSGVRALVRLSVDGAFYQLRLTDYEVSDRLRRQDFGVYDLADLGLPSERVLLTVSLGQSFHDRHYKLVAAVLRFG